MNAHEGSQQDAHRTFAEAAERYLGEFQGKDVMRCMQSIDALLPYIGDKRLADIDDEALEAFKHDRRNGAGHFKRPAMANTVNKDLAQAATILNKACKVWHWIQSAPKVRLLVGGESRFGYALTWEDQDRLFRQFPTGWDVGGSLFVLNTGIKKEQLFDLRWDDLVELPELGPEIFMFVLKRAKAKKRVVICNSIARRVVEYAKGNDPRFVFAKKCTRLQSGKVWRVAWQQAGLPYDPLIKRGFDNLRLTCDQRLRASGVPDGDRDLILGRTALHQYSMRDLKRLIDAAERITVRRETSSTRGVAVVLTHSIAEEPR